MYVQIFSRVFSRFCCGKPKNVFYTLLNAYYFFSVPQLPERNGENLPDRLHPNSAGCFAHTCEDHRDR